MIVYVVVTSVCSRQRIDAVFEDRRQAAYYCAISDNLETHIEEWDTEAVQFAGKQELLSRWEGEVKPDNEFEYLYERFTLKGEKRRFKQTPDGWDVTFTVKYGTPEETVRKLILDEIEALKSK